MALDESTIRHVLEHFDVGKFQRIIRPLESGFSSDNYLIQTSQGEFVIRILHESVDRIDFGMRVHEYLADNGIKTPRPARTKEGRLTYLQDDQLFVIQSFIRGEDIYEPLEAVDPLLPFYGRKLGEIHSILLKMPEDMYADRVKNWVKPFSWVRESSKKYMPDDEYVKNQYEIWLREIDQVTKANLTMGITHGDVGPKDFYFENGEFSGIMDFNSAEYGYLLSDVVSLMMYSQLIQPDRTKQYYTFMNSYLKTAPLQLEELNWLHPLLRGRWFVQIFYHQYRYIEGITQGLDSGDVEENLIGVACGISDLRVTNEYTNDYFLRVLL